MNPIRKLAVVVVLAAIASISQADVITFDDPDEFATYAASVNLDFQQEGFNFPIGSSGFEGPIVTPLVTVTCQECGLGLETQRTDIMEGTHILRTHANITRFEFPFEIFALSFYALDFGDQQGDFDEFLDLRTSGGEQFRLGFRPAGSMNPQNNLIFFGLISDRPLSSFEILTNQPIDGINIDPLRIAVTPPSIPDPAPVPEPGTLSLLGIGLAGMGLARRRRNV